MLSDEPTAAEENLLDFEDEEQEKSSAEATSSDDIVEQLLKQASVVLFKRGTMADASSAKQRFEVLLQQHVDSQVTMLQEEQAAAVESEAAANAKRVDELAAKLDAAQQAQTAMLHDLDRMCAAVNAQIQGSAHALSHQQRVIASLLRPLEGKSNAADLVAESMRTALEAKPPGTFAAQLQQVKQSAENVLSFCATPPQQLPALEALLQDMVTCIKQHDTLLEWGYCYGSSATSAAAVRNVRDGLYWLLKHDSRILQQEGFPSLSEAVVKALTDTSAACSAAARCRQVMAKASMDISAILQAVPQARGSVLERLGSAAAANAGSRAHSAERLDRGAASRDTSDRKRARKHE